MVIVPNPVALKFGKLNLAFDDVGKKVRQGPLDAAECGHCSDFSPFCVRFGFEEGSDRAFQDASYVGEATRPAPRNQNFIKLDF